MIAAITPRLSPSLVHPLVDEQIASSRQITQPAGAQHRLR
jgi:hypothetical protein